MARIEINDLTKRFGHINAVDDIGLELEKGQIIGLLGPNGSGKTTLIKMMTGLLTPTSGTITINGLEPGVETKKAVAYLPDRNALPDHMDTNKLIALYADFFDDFDSGSYAPGAKLPSVRDLAMDAGVNPNTMQRALAELERRGLVFSERTSGRFVTKEVAVLRKLHEELARVYFDEFAAKLMKIGMSATEISESIGKWISELPAQKAAE